MAVDIGIAEKAVEDLLVAFGVDEGDHTARTPARVAKSWAALLSGYDTDPLEHLAVTFTAPADPGLVVVSGITLSSVCAHHLLPFTGRATVAYRPSPGQSVVGLSKLSRVVDGYARRLQTQEQIGAQVVQALAQVLNPSGAQVLITAEHNCMKLRGVREPAAATTTVSTHGLITSDEAATIRAAHAEARG